MDLIKRIYVFKKNLKSDIPFVFFNDLDDINKLEKFLRNVNCYSTVLSYEEVDYNLVQIFSKLGFGVTDSVCLHNMTIGNSRYNIDKDGYCLFNFSINSLEYNEDDVVSYYSSNELSSEITQDIGYPIVKLQSGNEVVYYTVQSKPYIRQFDIKISDNITLTREYSNNDVFFMFDLGDRSFTIRIKKPVSKIVNDCYKLDNELKLINYLRCLRTFDIADIYNNLCEISLGSDISKFQEIELCESIKTNNGWKNVNLISIKNGNMDSVVRTIGDKTITCYGNGNWNYMISDENVTFVINSGKTLRYKIEANNDKSMDDYMGTLFKYDIGVAKQEVEDTKKLVKHLGIGIKKKR